MNDGSLSSGLIRVIFRSISFRLFITDWNELKLIAPCSLRVSSLVTSRSVHLPLTVSHAINLHSGCFTAPIHSFSFVALTSLHSVFTTFISQSLLILHTVQQHFINIHTVFITRLPLISFLHFNSTRNSISLNEGIEWNSWNVLAAPLRSLRVQFISIRHQFNFNALNWLSGWIEWITPFSASPFHSTFIHSV